MFRFRSSNPALNEKVFANARSYGVGETMTMQGCVNKCIMLFFMVLMSATWIWNKVPKVSPYMEEYAIADAASGFYGYIMAGSIVGFVAVIVTMFNLSISRFTAPIYALAQGVALGGMSAVLEIYYPGIALQAVGLTFGTFFSMLMIYKSGLIKVTDKFRFGISAALGAVFIVYLTSFILGFFGRDIPLIHGSGPVGIGFSLIVVVIAALFLLVDFDLIERLSSNGSPRHMEWYGAMSLLITLVWLYVEFLRLLIKLRGSQR